MTLAILPSYDISSQLASSNIYSILYPENLGNKIHCQGNTKRVRNIWHILQPLREVWIKVGLKKIKSYKGVAVKVLLDSSATGLFIDIQFAKEKRFKLERLKNPLLVRNIDGIINIEGAIIHQVKYNMFFKGHIERVRIDICNLEKTKVILGIPQLATHNPKIDWKKGEVKMTRCPSICRRKKQEKREKKIRKTEKEKTVEKLVLKRFWK